MSLESITRKILEDARARAAAIDKEAKDAEDSIIGEAREKARSILEQGKSDASAEAARIAAEAKAGAEIEANALLLEARGSATERELQGVLDIARRELVKNRMAAILESSVKQFKRLNSGMPKIAADRRSAALLKGRGYSMEQGSADGFVLSSSDGSLSLDATVDSIVRHEADAARGLVSAELFKGHGPGKRSEGRPRRAKSKVPAKPVRKRGKRGRGR